MADPTQQSTDAPGTVAEERPAPVQMRPAPVDAQPTVAGEPTPAGLERTAPPHGSPETIPAIATWTAPEPGADGLTPLSPRTGEPTRVWSVWVASVASFLAVATIGASCLWVFWDAVFTFTSASWLMGQFGENPDAVTRVLLAVAVTVVTLLVGSASAITGYYSYDGRSWTRWSGLVALLLSGLALLLNPLAWAAIGLALVAAIALWLPPTKRYFASWQAQREHSPVFAEPARDVEYGPLPRFR